LKVHETGFITAFCGVSECEWYARGLRRAERRLSHASGKHDLARPLELRPQLILQLGASTRLTARIHPVSFHPLDIALKTFDSRDQLRPRVVCPEESPELRELEIESMERKQFVAAEELRRIHAHSALPDGIGLSPGELDPAPDKLIELQLISPEPRFDLLRAPSVERVLDSDDRARHRRGRRGCGTT
jgi:hypothetical protein